MAEHNSGASLASVQQIHEKNMMKLRSL